MAIYDVKQLLDRYDSGYLIVDFNHPFIASTLREEIWLLEHRDDLAMLEGIAQEAAAFQIAPVDEDRDIDTYSGGEKVILACLLMLAVIRARRVRGIKLLLSNVIDSLSENNREILLEKFHQSASDLGLRLFVGGNHSIEEIDLEHEHTARNLSH